MLENIEQFFIIYTIAGMFLMLPSWVGAYALFEDDYNREVKIGVVVSLFSGPGVWVTILLIYLGYTLMKLIGKTVDYIQAKLEKT